MDDVNSHVLVYLSLTYMFSSPLSKVTNVRAITLSMYVLPGNGIPSLGIVSTLF